MGVDVIEGQAEIEIDSRIDSVLGVIQTVNYNVKVGKNGKKIGFNDMAKVRVNDNRT